jgi:intein/homing endonuclease
MSWNKIWKGVDCVDFDPERPPFVWTMYDKLLPGYNYKGRKVLEFGCGTGINSTIMAYRGAKVTMCDLSQEALDLTRKNLDRLGLDAELIQGDLFDTDFKSEFDLVHCLAGDSRILTEDGLVAISELEGSKKLVLSYDEKSRKLKKTRIFCAKSGNSETYSVTLESGRVVRATRNHRFFTSRGWLRLCELSDNDLLAVNALPAFDKNLDGKIMARKNVFENFIKNFLEPRKCKTGKCKYKHSFSDYKKVMELYRSGIKSRKTLQELTGVPAGSINNWLVGREPPKSAKILARLEYLGLAPLRNNEKACAIARIMGHVFSDGWVSKSGERVRFIVGKNGHDDIDEIRRDLRMIGISYGKKDEKTNKRPINGKMVVQNVIEMAAGSKEFWVLLGALGAPLGRKSLTEYKIPEWITKSKALQREFLGTYLGGDGGYVKMLVKGSRVVRITLEKARPLKGSGLYFAGQVSSILKNFGIKSSVRSMDTVLNGKDMVRIVITISNETKSILNLCEIGYKYCSKKSVPANYAGEYFRIKSAELKARNEMGAQVEDLLSSGLEAAEVSDKLGVPKCFVYNRVYGQDFGIPKSFPCFDDWKANATKGLGENVVWEGIASIKPSGKKEDVYDIQVLDGPANFFANGILVHNSEGLVEHFLPPKRQEIMDIHSTAVKKGGKLLIIVPHSKCPPYRAGKLLAELTRTWIYTNEYPYTRPELVKRMQMAGLKPGPVVGGETIFALTFMFSPLILQSSRLIRKGIKRHSGWRMNKINYNNWLSNRWGRVIGCVGEK